MDIEELLAREQIRHTLARYSIAGDRLDLETYIATFTRDGAVEMDGLTVRGRDAIRQWLGANLAYQRADGSRPSFTRHHLTTSQLELTSPTTARGRTYWQVVTDVGLDHAGTYNDRFRVEDGQWLIEHRKVATNWVAPDSFVRDAVEKARRG